MFDSKVLSRSGKLPPVVLRVRHFSGIARLAQFSRKLTHKRLPFGG